MQEIYDSFFYHFTKWLEHEFAALEKHVARCLIKGWLEISNF